MSSVYSNYVKRMRMCVNGNCKGCTYQYEGLTNTEECKEDLLYDAAEQLKDADKCNAKLVKKYKEAEKRIAELEAQLPKDGEWNIRETASGDVEAKCPKCGFEMLVNQPGNGLLMVSELLYCPHCGSRMAKGEQNG